ncbi:MAG: hypothetical protein RLZZ126_1585 [Pseudomonadota bacterium]|jgi:GntR family transcriptional regulator, transcriptional repressor for pyruvate dehydrogenase complex
MSYAPYFVRRPRGRVETVVDAILNQVRSGELKPGDRLPTEADVTAQFSVSRTVVREALSRLQAQGLVETRHGVGTFVRDGGSAPALNLGRVQPGSLAEVIALLELRISIETEAASLAAQRRTPAQLQAIHSALADFQHALSSNDANIESDLRFHLEVARATGNTHFPDLLSHLGDKAIPRKHLDTARAALEGRSTYLLKVLGEHESIYNAIRNQDSEAARAAMRTHLSNSCDRLRKAQLGAGFS